VREYDATELSDELSPHFRAVTVYGMYPRVLDRVYYGISGLRVVDQVVRGGFKVLAKWVANPYEHLIMRSPQSGWANLVALAVA
jgi:hypothetical protein